MQASTATDFQSYRIFVQQRRLPASYFVAEITIGSNKRYGSNKTLSADLLYRVTVWDTQDCINGAPTIIAILPV
jgi:hypothetical protein